MKSLLSFSEPDGMEQEVTYAQVNKASTAMVENELYEST